MRATQFFHYINQEKEVDKEDKLLYTHLTITDEIKKIRRDHLVTKKTGLIPKDNGTFTLF